MIAPIRAAGLPAMPLARVFALGPDHPVIDQPCPACGAPFTGGARIVLVLVGPGPDPEDQRKAREGRWHTAAAVPVHALCAGVEDG